MVEVMSNDEVDGMRVFYLDFAESETVTPARTGVRRMIAMTDRPRVGISACLLGERVRYDGRDKLDAWLVDVLGPEVEWVPVCPEVEAGFGTPREPMTLVRDAHNSVVLMTTRPRPDLTATLRRYAEQRVDELGAAGLDGYVLKAGSPSCAIETTINAEHAKTAEHAERNLSASFASSAGSALSVENGAGLFAEALMRRLPDLPVVDEQQLADRDVRRRFVERVFARRAADKIIR
jgi:uncharacterized protein YbbK (DUF523 family)